MHAWLRAFRKPKPPELDNELQFHIEALVEEKIAQGLSRARARREAEIGRAHV